MFLHIARKEFHNNLLSARFVIGFLLCLVLIPFSVLIGIGDYRDQAGQYRIDRDAAEKTMKEVRVWSYLRPILVFPPEPLGIFGKGISGKNFIAPLFKDIIKSFRITSVTNRTQPF